MQAAAVYRAMNWLAERGMPDLGRPDPRSRTRRYWLTPPQETLYTVKGDTLWVLGIRDSRRRREPW